MGIMIKGIRLPAVNIGLSDDGKLEVSGKYELLSDNDTVLAKQGFNGYNELKVGASPETMGKVNSLVASLKLDIETILGIKGGE